MLDALGGQPITHLLLVTRASSDGVPARDSVGIRHSFALSLTACLSPTPISPRRRPWQHQDAANGSVNDLRGDYRVTILSRATPARMSRAWIFFASFKSVINTASNSQFGKASIGHKG